MSSSEQTPPPNPMHVWAWLQNAAKQHGLNCLGVSDTKLSACAPLLQAWLNAGMHGTMNYMQRHGLDRLKPDYILPGTVSIVSVQVPYLPADSLRPLAYSRLSHALKTVEENTEPYISLYAHGRDYHKAIRSRLKKLMCAAHSQWAGLGYRITCDSAPTPEVEIARKAGLGWRGKHTLLINPRAGSLFFLAEIFTNLPLPLTGEFSKDHCGTCTQCMGACPTQAIVQPYKVDARLCISYLTIEHDGPIPLGLRRKMGTRLYGCDDCQLVCPWNKFAQTTTWADFNAKPQFATPSWNHLMRWNETDFLHHTEGSAIRRIGFERWQRNLTIAAGNALYTLRTQHLAGNTHAAGQVHELETALATLHTPANHWLAEHVQWALKKVT